MAVTLTYKSQMKVVETLTGNTDSAADANRRVTHEEFDEGETLISTSTPPVTMCAYFVQALSGGAATIDLTSVTGTNGASVDMSGLKVQMLRMKNLGANPMSLTFGASNPYELLGADFKMTLNQDQWVTVYGDDSTPDVAGGAKEMDLAGTASQTCEFSLVAG